MPKDVILTPEGLTNLKDELELLSTEKRREVAERIKEAREFGDISENSEYDDAKNEQAMLEARIAALQEKLRLATVIQAQDLSNDVVQVGSVVHVKDEKTGKSAKYTIVGSAEASPQENKLSNESPVGRALIGRRRNETVAVKVPRGPARKLEGHEDRRRPEVGSTAMSGTEQPPTPVDPGRHGLAELIDERRAKAQRLRAQEGAFPYSFGGAEPIQAILEQYAHLAVGEETEDSHRVAGRIAARRGAGKAAFLDLVDRTGKIQLHARVDVLGKEGLQRLLSLDLGDLLGVDGAVLRSRHGELTLRVDAYQVLAKALRPPPDKHHGLSDVETRYRRRELDLIASEERATGLHRPRADHLRRSRVPRRAGLHRGRDPRPAAALRGRAGASVHHPPQRAGPRPVPADRHRALPQAADRRWPGARVRARQGLSQRGRLANAQPRVHDGRVV